MVLGRQLLVECLQVGHGDFFAIDGGDDLVRRNLHGLGILGHGDAGETATHGQRQGAGRQ